METLKAIPPFLYTHTFMMSAGVTVPLFVLLPSQEMRKHTVAKRTFWALQQMPHTIYLPPDFEELMLSHQNVVSQVQLRDTVLRK